MFLSRTTTGRGQHDVRRSTLFPRGRGPRPPPPPPRPPPTPPPPGRSRAACPRHAAPRSADVPNEVISTCPVCSHELAVTRLHCGHCGTTLEGDFSVGRYGRLSREQLALLESFLRSRGNLREMERELGISYPTVRNRVEALVRALGLTDGEVAGPTMEAEVTEVATAVPDTEPTKEQVTARRTEILSQVARGELSAADAAEAIRRLGRGA